MLRMKQQTSRLRQPKLLLLRLRRLKKALRWSKLKRLLAMALQKFHCLLRMLRRLPKACLWLTQCQLSRAWLSKALSTMLEFSMEDSSRPEVAVSQFRLVDVAVIRLRLLSRLCITNQSLTNRSLHRVLPVSRSHRLQFRS